MKHIVFSGLIFMLTGCSSIGVVDATTTSNQQSKAFISPLAQKSWIHGALDCELNQDPAIDVFRYQESSYILRQNKCLNYEAPFIYVLFGDEKIVVVDTGATESALDFPLYKVVNGLIEEQSKGKIQSTEKSTLKSEREILVIHSHSHSDHYTGDIQFNGKPNVTVVAPNTTAVDEFFAFNKQPTPEVTIDLGGRKITVIHTPGHQEDAIAIYDSKTKWLLTGDSLYPGYIYVKDWDEYKNSIERLALFSNENEVSAVLGAHIEMTNKAGEYYPIGSVYQPHEASLALSPDHLNTLNTELQKSDQPEQIVFDEFIVAPMNAFQKTLSTIGKWFTQ